MSSYIKLLQINPDELFQFWCTNLDVPILNVSILDVPILDVPVLDVPVLDVPTLDVPVLDIPAFNHILLALLRV